MYRILTKSQLMVELHSVNWSLQYVFTARDKKRDGWEGEDKKEGKGMGVILARCCFFMRNFIPYQTVLEGGILVLYVQYKGGKYVSRRTEPKRI